MELVKIAVMGLQEAKDLQKECQGLGADLVLNHNDQTCTRGCSVTVEVHAHEKDIPVVQKVYTAKYQKSLKGLDFDVETINSVYDPSAESATCPACGHEFSTSHSECPDCGLAF